MGKSSWSGTWWWRGTVKEEAESGEEVRTPPDPIPGLKAIDEEANAPLLSSSLVRPPFLLIVGFGFGVLFSFSFCRTKFILVVLSGAHESW